MTGAILFLILFLLIAPKTRAIIMGMLGHSGDWLNQYAPFSYAILALIGFAGVISLALMVRWPKVPEPENPLARYKAEDVMED